MGKQEVSREQAEHVLETVRSVVGESGAYGPALYAHDHEEMPEGCWSIAFEGWSQDTPWTLLVPPEQVPDGVFVEAMNSWCLGVYPA